MWPFGVVINSPGFDEFFRFLEADEPVFVEAFVSEGSVEALNKRVLNGFPRLDKLQLDAMLVGPAVEDFTGELGSIIGNDAGRMAPVSHETVEHAADPEPARETNQSRQSRKADARARRC